MQKYSPTWGFSSGNPAGSQWKTAAFKPCQNNARDKIAGLLCRWRHGAYAADGSAMTEPTDKRALLDLMQRAGSLLFGSFTLKSGRISPYFFNVARFQSGPLLEELGLHYARAIERVAPGATIVFGPAYKGIPLSIATAMALSHVSGRSIGYLFNRKEEKTHGDRGVFVGQTPGAGDRVVLVDDVITDGETKREAVALLRSVFPAPIAALVIAFDRMEQDSQGRDALQEFQRDTGVPVFALLTLADLEQLLEDSASEDPAAAAQHRAKLEEMRAYRRRYGVTGRPR